MDCFIKKIFGGKTDEFVHLQFTKFSKGEFRNKAVIIGKKMSGDKYSINTTPEYANEIVRFVAEKIPGDEKIKITGAIVSTRDLTGEIEFKDKKQFQGVKRYIIDTEMTKKEIISHLDNYPKSFLALSFKVGDTELKIKPKAPKSGKPGKGNECPKADFCKLKTKDKELVKSFFLDDEISFKKIEISHTFLITGLDIPKDEKDPVKMRENTIRGGKIIRKVNLDGDDKTKEIEFKA